MRCIRKSLTGSWGCIVAGSVGSVSDGALKQARSLVGGRVKLGRAVFAATVGSANLSFHAIMASAFILCCVTANCTLGARVAVDGVADLPVRTRLALIVLKECTRHSSIIFMIVFIEI